MLFQLIDGRSGNTDDDIKVMPHLEDVGPTAIKQNKIAFHQHACTLFGKTLFPKRRRNVLLPDMNLERKAKNAERIGVIVANQSFGDCASGHSG